MKDEDVLAFIPILIIGILLGCAFDGKFLIRTNFTRWKKRIKN